MKGIQILPHQTRINGLAVSRAFGDHFIKNENLGVISEPYVSECIKLEPEDDILIIASDGVNFLFFIKYL